MKRLLVIPLQVSLGLLAALTAAPVVAEAPPASSAKANEDAAARYFTNTKLVDQDGKVRHFHDDLLRGKKVLINVAFTSCKGACPVMTANLAKVQRLLGARMGKAIHIITVTADPENDTPAVLKQYADRHGATAGWYFLTGAPDDVNKVLGRIGGLLRKPEDHATTLYVGNLATGNWVKTQATSRPEDIVYLVDHLDDPKR
ncbi:MAG TPA: SCO family protein [Polyangium sp.]|nr:SCO family protein [Polyangium sp.]